MTTFEVDYFDTIDNEILEVAIAEPLCHDANCLAGQHRLEGESALAAALISEGRIDLMIFFWDNLSG